VVLDALTRDRHSKLATFGSAGASKEEDDLAPLHSITSSALANSANGTLKPSILAVLTRQAPHCSDPQRSHRD
jgi:hypothetical protein